MTKAQKKAPKKVSRKLRAPVRKLLDDLQWELVDQYNSNDEEDRRQNPNVVRLRRLIGRIERVLKTDRDT